MRSANLTSMRGVQRLHNGSSLPPVRKELTGPNQRWCWEISYLFTYEKGIFLYLYLLLDEYSRKALSWRISWHQTAQEAQHLLEQALIHENILDIPEDHDMPQLFARPRTPNDNPFIELLFGIIKRAPRYPGRFLDLDDAFQYFSRYVPWYTFEHYHSRIDNVTPMPPKPQRHHRLFVERKLQQQRQLRKEVNRLDRKPLTADEVNCMLDPNLIIPCSVINP